VFPKRLSIYSFPNKLIKNRLTAISYAMFLRYSTIKTSIVRKLGKNSVFKLLKNVCQKKIVIFSWSGRHHRFFTASPRKFLQLQKFLFYRAWDAMQVFFGFFYYYYTNTS